MAFDVQQSDRCLADYFVIDNERYCGVRTGLTLNLPFTEPTYTLRFHSDNVVENVGFNISVKQITQQFTIPRQYWLTIDFITTPLYAARESRSYALN